MKSIKSLVNLILKAVAVAMGVAVAVLSIIGELETKSAILMLAIGLSCAGISQLATNSDESKQPKFFLQQLNLRMEFYWRNSFRISLIYRQRLIGEKCRFLFRKNRQTVQHKNRKMENWREGVELGSKTLCLLRRVATCIQFPCNKQRVARYRAVSNRAPRPEAGIFSFLLRYTCNIPQ